MTVPRGKQKEISFPHSSARLMQSECVNEVVSFIVCVGITGLIMALHPNRGSFGEVTLLLWLYCLVSLFTQAVHTQPICQLHKRSAVNMNDPQMVLIVGVSRERWPLPPAASLSEWLAMSLGCSPFSHKKVSKTPTKQFCVPWGL